MNFIYCLICPKETLVKYIKKRRKKKRGPYNKFIKNLENGLNNSNSKIRNIAEREYTRLNQLGKKYLEKNLMKDISLRLNDPSLSIRNNAQLAYKYFYQKVGCC